MTSTIRRRVDVDPPAGDWLSRCGRCGRRFAPDAETAVHANGAVWHQECVCGVPGLDLVAFGRWPEMAAVAGDPVRLDEARVERAAILAGLRSDARARGLTAPEPPICRACAHGVAEMGHGPGCPRATGTLGWGRCVEAIGDDELFAAYRRGAAIGSLAELDARAAQIRAEKGGRL